MKNVKFLTSNGIDVISSLDIFGDIDTYNETLKDFLVSVENKMKQISNYKETADCHNYAIMVHSLKSDAKYLGFVRLAELAYKHELESKANNLDFVYSEYQALVDEARRVINITKEYMGEEPVQFENTSVVFPTSTIIVVDDSDMILNFIQKIFKTQYRVLVAKDGKEAIDLIGTNTSHIVGMFLDLNMPNIDGFEVLNYFEQNNLFVKIPVAIITGEDSKKNISKIFDYPIIDVLSKPFNERDLRKALDKILN